MELISAERSQEPVHGDDQGR